MMTTHTQLSIIVPCYNEEQRIAHTISKLLPAVDKLNISYEIILVNDGSVDDTNTIIKDLAHDNSNIKVLSYHLNKGKGYAVKCGIKKSQGEYYLIMDADLATDISELKKFWNKRTTADCLIGNRKNEHNQRNAVRDIAGGISHGLVNTVLNLKLKDTQCGFKLLSSKTKNMWSHVHSERRGFDFELLYLLQKNGYSIKEIDVKRNDIAGSKVTFSSYLTTWKELRNTSRIHNIKTLDRINQFVVSALAVMGIVFYGVANVVQAQNETTTITECVSYDSSSYNSNNQYPAPAEACGDAAGQVTDEFPVGGLCRTGTPFLQNITTTIQENVLTFDPGSKVAGTISIIKKGVENRIIIAGDFIGYDKEPRNGIAVIDLNSDLIRDFDPMDGFNGDITDIIPQSNGQIIVRGNFTDYNKIARNGIARLNPDGSLDEVFDPARYLDGVITAVNLDSQENVFIGGKFTEYDKEIANTLIKLNRDGSRDKDFNVGLGAAGFISSIAFGTDESIFIGGDFDDFDKSNKIDLVKLNKDGSVDTSFDAKILPKYISTITYILTTDKGQVIVAGSLGETDERGNTVLMQSSIVQLDSTGKEDTSFTPVTTNSNSTISFMTFQDSDVIFLGDFINLNDKITRNGVARVDAYGTILDFDPSSYSDGTIKSLSVQNPEKILIAGTFGSYNDKDDSKQRNTAARIERDATLEADSINTTILIDEYTWSCIDTVVNYDSNGSASATSYDSNGSASATSYSSNGSASATSYNAYGSATSYNSNGSATSYNSNTLAYCNSFDITNYNSNNYVNTYSPLCGTAAGQTTNSFPTGNLCAAGITPFLQNIQIGNLDHTFMATSNGGNILSMVKQPDGKILIGGRFQNINGVMKSKIARLNPDGSLDTSFVATVDNTVVDNNQSVIRHIVLQSDGKILIGGDFTSINGVSRNNLARLNSDGSLDNSFVASVNHLLYGQTTNLVKSMALQPDGKILIGGDFDHINGSSRNKIARLNPDGSLDNSFVGYAIGTNTLINSILLQPDGKILIGGNFTSINGVSRNNLARLNSDGSLDNSFVASAGTPVSSLALQPDGKIIGYALGQVGVVSRLNPDGSLDTSFNSTARGAYDIKLQSDGKILIGGSEASLNGTIQWDLVRLNTDGSLDNSFIPKFNHQVQSILIEPDGKIIVGGQFSIINGITKNIIARLNPNAGLEQYTWACLDPNGNYNSNGSATSYNSYGSATSYNSYGSATSYNSNGSATSYNSYGSATSYNSNGSATSYNSNGSATSYNSNGSATSYNSNGSATSYNSNGSATSYNSNLGQCGTAAGGSFPMMPTTNLCNPNTNNTTLTVWDALGQDGTYNWSCGIDHYTYSSASCSATRVTDGVCGSAAGGITPTFPTENLCAAGMPYLQQVVLGDITVYTWTCAGIGPDTIRASCSSFQTPTTDACIPYGQSGTTQYNINNVLLPGTNVGLMLNYNYENGDFANLANNAVQTATGKLANAANVDYTDSSTYTLNGIVNPSVSLQVSFTNLNTQGTETGQFIQYRQPADIAARSIRSTLINRINGRSYLNPVTEVLEQDTIIGSNWYGCNPSGWRTSLVGLVPNSILDAVNTSNVTNNTSNGLSVFGRFSTTPNPNNSSADTANDPTIGWLSTSQQFLSYQNDNGEWIVWIDQIQGWINVNDSAERFLYWDQEGKGFKVECNLCATPTPVTTQTGTCVNLPDHAIPNIATEIIQYTGANGWFPSTTYTYNTITSTTDCTFVCENNYSRVDGECKPNTNTQSCVGGIPQYAVLTVPGANTYTSTWNGSGWVPSIRTYTYNPTVYSDPALNACNYTCPANYNRNGGACIPVNNTGICGGTLPTNATVTNGTTFPQSRNGSEFIPTIRVYTYGYGTCGFLCNANYTRNPTTLTCNPNTQTVACNGVQPANTNPTNGTTYTQTRNGSEWAPTVSWALGSTGSCGYTCQDGYTRNGSVCEANGTPFTYGRYTGDWSTCPVNTGTVITTGNNNTGATNTYSRDIGEWGACSLAGGSCDGFYAAAGSGGTCTNITGNNGGMLGGCVSFAISSPSRGDGNSHNSNAGTFPGISNPTCYTYTTEAVCNANAGSSCSWLNLGGGVTTTTSAATCAQATTQTSCMGEPVRNDYVGTTYVGGIAGCSWAPTPVMTSCSDIDETGFLPGLACEYGRPGCTWNINTSGSTQARDVVCRNQYNNIVPDSFCTQPKPDTTQAGVCNVFANGTCGSALGTPSVTVPTVNLCSSGFAGAVPTSFTGGNGSLIWFWSCQGTAGGTYSFCSAPNTTGSNAINGVCGSSNNQTYTDIPANNLCNVGTESNVSGNGPRYRSCEGSNGGTTDQCIAAIDNSGGGDGNNNGNSCGEEVCNTGGSPMEYTYMGCYGLGGSIMIPPYTCQRVE